MALSVGLDRQWHQARQADQERPARRPRGRVPFGDLLPPAGAALSLLVIMVSVLAIPLRAAGTLGLTPGQTAAWIMGVYGGAGAIGLLLVMRYRQPLLVTGNVFVLLFVASLGDQLSWAELVGASMVAGAVVLAAGPLRLTERLTAWLPPPIVFGILAGAVLPFFVDLFSALGTDRVVVGAMVAAYLAGRRLLGPRLPAVLPAVVVGLAAAALTGQVQAPPAFSWPSPELTAPVFSLRGIVTATPVIVVLVALQANLPSVVFLRSQGYAVPEGAVTVTSGGGTALASLLGPTGVSLSLPATALCAGPEAGDHRRRHWAAAIAGVGGLVIALLAGMAAELAASVPPALLVGAVGLAVVPVLGHALTEAVRGPLTTGPMFAFAIVLSDLSLLGLGPFFWALVAAPVVSMLTEPAVWRDRACRYGQFDTASPGSAAQASVPVPPSTVSPGTPSAAESRSRPWPPKS